MWGVVRPKDKDMAPSRRIPAAARLAPGQALSMEDITKQAFGRYLCPDACRGESSVNGKNST